MRRPCLWGLSLRRHRFTAARLDRRALRDPRGDAGLFSCLGRSSDAACDCIWLYRRPAVVSRRSRLGSGRIFGTRTSRESDPRGPMGCSIPGLVLNFASFRQELEKPFSAYRCLNSIAEKSYRRMPSLAKPCSACGAQPRFAIGLAGEGCRIVPILGPLSPKAKRARFSAHAPMPITHFGR